MNVLKKIKRNSHIKINDQDFMTYEYARSKDISVTNKESWIIEGVTYFMLTEDIVVDIEEEILGVGA
tara:strand:+ start:440 stop:640 length:201 start_codon:yes stop_codon:yes gene_type:complete